MIGRGTGKGESSAGHSQSWRDLAGSVRPRKKSSLLRRRRWRALLKLLSLVGVLLGLLGGGFWLWQKADDPQAPMEISAPSQPLENILFKTDGALPDQWLSRTVDLSIGTNLMEIDIYDLKERLEKVGQVRTATVERAFPNALRISLKEQSPVLRLVLQAKDGTLKEQVVSDDGTVYDGIGYSRTVRRGLPYLQPYLHGDGGYLPVLGIPRVAELLQLAKSTYPELCGDWDVVSLEHYTGDTRLPGQIIEVRTKLVPRILFGAGKDFDLQLKRLEYILEKVQDSGNPSMERIDLSLRGLAAVQFSSREVNFFP
jgi:hypothetical protein